MLFIANNQLSVFFYKEHDGPLRKKLESLIDLSSVLTQVSAKLNLSRVNSTRYFFLVTKTLKGHIQRLNSKAFFPKQ